MKPIHDLQNRILKLPTARTHTHTFSLKCTAEMHRFRKEIKHYYQFFMLNAVRTISFTLPCIFNVYANTSINIFVSFFFPLDCFPSPAFRTATNTYYD